MSDTTPEIIMTFGGMALAILVAVSCNFCYQAGYGRGYIEAIKPPVDRPSMYKIKEQKYD